MLEPTPRMKATGATFDIVETVGVGVVEVGW